MSRNIALIRRARMMVTGSRSTVTVAPVIPKPVSMSVTRPTRVPALLVDPAVPSASRKRMD
jgi:hypothetical protein